MQNNNEYYTTKEVLDMLKIHMQTLYRWRKARKINFIQLGKKTFLYNKNDINKMLNNNDMEINNKKNIIYCRISNQKQNEDLLKQKQLLIDYCNINGIIPDLILTEIASGIDENRVEFNNLLDLVINNKVNKVFITYKDRLISFGFNYFKNLFKKYNTEIIILNNPINENNMQQELMTNLISIICSLNIKKEIQKQLKKIK